MQNNRIKLVMLGTYLPWQDPTLNDIEFEGVLNAHHSFSKYRKKRQIKNISCPYALRPN